MINIPRPVMGIRYIQPEEDPMPCGKPDPDSLAKGRQWEAKSPISVTFPHPTGSGALGYQPSRLRALLTTQA